MGIVGKTDWDLIREVMNGTINACERLERLGPDSAKGEYQAAPDSFPGETIGGFLSRFVMYPERAQREIVWMLSHLNDNQGILNQLARSLVYTAMACAEVVGLPEEKLKQEFPDLKQHCDSAGHSVESHLRAIAEIQNKWMVPCIEEALNKVRDSQ